MDELISIIVPVYNVERYLDACMASIRNQTYGNIEIIAVDDGSTDNSGAICDHYAQADQRIKVIHKENGGLSDARNQGLLHAKGDYILFVDSDDVVSPDIVEYLYQLIQNNAADIGICDPVHCYPGKKIVFQPETFRRIYEPEDAIAEMLYQRSFLVAACGKIYRREYFSDISFPYGMLFEDSAVMCRIFDKAKKIVYGNAKLYGYMHREGSITNREFSKENCDIWIICEQMAEYMSGRSEKLRKAARSYQTAAAFRIYMNAPRNGAFDEELEKCEAFLKANQALVLQDPRIRRKLKMALLMYQFMKPLMPVVYKRINRWK